MIMIIWRRRKTLGVDKPARPFIKFGSASDSQYLSNSTNSDILQCCIDRNGKEYDGGVMMDVLKVMHFS